MNPSAASVQPASEMDPVLAELVEEITNKLQAGEPVDLEAVARRHPAVGDQLRRLLPAMQALADLGSSAARGGGGRHHGRDGVAPILSDYRILREIGRGGMGVVYQAEQMSLGRHVALKVLPFAAALDPRQLQRFKNEAQAAAQLHHTHIVPVFSVGCEQGVHYYAMQYIEGQSLAAVVAELRRLAGLEPESAAALSESREVVDPDRTIQVRRGAVAPPAAVDASAGQGTDPRGAISTQRASNGPAFFRTVATLGIQAAEGLEHAHAMGIIHRDIKPANLLLDLRGNVWITDFGLAQFQNDLRLTMTGDVLGTLRYMSPEQALGKRGLIDHRTDVYALGATLYELLTLEPVVPGRDRHEVLRQLSFGEPRPPRHLNRSIPAELETIILKATSRELLSRYGTAQELADDLRRFLNDKPILARRPTVGERLMRWCRRRFAVVMAAVVVLFLVTVTLAISTFLIWRARTQAQAAHQDVEAAHQRESRAREQAEDHYRQARQAVDDMYTQVAERWIASEPQLEPLQREFLHKALKFYEDFAREQGADRTAQRSVASAYVRVGRIQAKLGQPAPAEAALRQGIAAWRAVRADSQGSPEDERHLAMALGALGILLRDQGRPREAEETLLEAVALATRGLQADPGNAAARSQFAATLQDLANLVLARGEVARAVGLYRDALEHQQQALKTSPGSMAYRFLLQKHLAGLAKALSTHGDAGGAETAYRDSLAALTDLIAESPSNPEFRYSFANGQNSLGALLVSRGRLRQAQQAYEEARANLEKLTADFPRVPDYPNLLGGTLNNLARIHIQQGEPSRAELRVVEAIRNQKLALQMNPGHQRYRLFLVNQHMTLADAQSRLGRLGEAETTIVEAHRLAGELHQEYPAALEHRHALASCHTLGANVAMLRNRPADAIRESRLAIAFLDGLSAEAPGEFRYRQQLASLSYNLGSLLLGQGQDLAEALRMSRQAADAYEQLRKDHPDQSVYRLQLARCCALQATLYQRAGQREEAEQVGRRGVEHFETFLAAHPAHGECRRDLGGALHNLGKLRWERGEPEVACRLLERAIQQQWTALRANAHDRLAWQYLRQHSRVLGPVTLSLGRPREAILLALAWQTGERNQE